MWQELLTSVLTSGLITGVFVLIINKAIENKFEMKIEAYKDKLKAESDKELLQLTKDLELKASERNIKLTEVFKTQCDIIVSVYKNLLSLQAATTYFRTTSNISEPEDKKLARLTFQTAFKTFNEHFYPNEIYIQSKTVKLINNYVAALRSIFVKHNAANIFEALPQPRGISQQQISERIGAMHDEIITIDVQIPPLLVALKNDFQNILGIPIENTSVVDKL